MFLSKRPVSFLIVGLMFGATSGFLVAFFIYQLELWTLFAIPKNVLEIAGEMRVEIQEGDNKTREVFLNPAQNYCKHIVFQGRVKILSLGTWPTRIIQ